MQRLFPTYRVLAVIVGILLTVLVFVAMPLKYLTHDGSGAESFGTTLTSIVGVTHGWCYIAYVVVAFLLARRLRWPLPFSVLVLLAGLVPILIFWVEHRVVLRVRAQQHPEPVTP